VGASRNRAVRPQEKALKAAPSNAASLSAASWAPPPGAHSGIADYAEVLSRALGDVPIDLYHLGNNRLHAEIYDRALRHPGVIVLHDAVLHHFLLGQLSEERYLAEWVFNYGEWRRELGMELWHERARSGTDPRYFRFAMVRRVVEASKAVIVHNAGAAAIAREHGATDLTVIPHFFDRGTEAFCAEEIAHFRRDLGAGRTTTIFGIFGYLRETKRVMSSLASFRRLHATGRDVVLLLAGEPVSPDLARVLGAEAIHPAIHRWGHLTERELRLAAAAIDCGLNLRYPAAGETSGIAIRLMGIGKPVIGSDIEENSDIPETAMLRVSTGSAEAEELFNAMVLVERYPDIARQIGAEAAAHILEHHSLAEAARKYRETLDRAAGSV
jgi:glycosyltransferase involved in cell wall biosynthesis